MWNKFMIIPFGVRVFFNFCLRFNFLILLSMNQDYLNLISRNLPQFSAESALAFGNI